MNQSAVYDHQADVSCRKAEVIDQLSDGRVLGQLDLEWLGRSRPVDRIGKRREEPNLDLHVSAPVLDSDSSEPEAEPAALESKPAERKFGDADACVGAVGL